MIQKLDHINIVVQFIGELRIFAKSGKKLIYFYGPDSILLELAEYPPVTG